jgi:hypothetical protein
MGMGAVLPNWRGADRMKGPTVRNCDGLLSRRSIRTAQHNNPGDTSNVIHNKYLCSYRALVRQWRTGEESWKTEKINKARISEWYPIAQLGCPSDWMNKFQDSLRKHSTIAVTDPMLMEIMLEGIIIRWLTKTPYPP